MKVKQIKVQEILLKQNYLTESDLNIALKTAKVGALLTYLTESKILTKELIGQAIAEYYKIKYFSTESKQIDPKVMMRLPLDFCQENMTILVEETDKELVVVTSDPEHLDFLTEKIKAYIPNKKIVFNYALDSNIEGSFVNIKQPLQSRFDKIIEENYYSAPDIFDEIIMEAAENKASDVHFEPLSGEKVNLRFRVDGILREMGSIPKDVYDKVINRIKVLSYMQIDEHFAPQDGSIRIDTENFILDLRVSIIPTIEGEKTVIRILSDFIKDLNIEDLGFDKISYNLLDESLKQRYGMILNTGPTGSGKSTTLYAVLKLIKSSAINITTIEDPVEYRIKGVNQIQVDPGHDISFARGLRSIVRQDPNVILVGEIRDNETAEIAVNAALTGHLLLSTFHANDAATAIPRLMDMGVEPFLLASTLNLIMAQRLVRRICLNCRYSVEYTTDEIKKIIGVDAKKYFPEKTTRLYKAKGCEICNHTGFKGRIAVLEMIRVSEAMRDLIERIPSSQDIWELARSEGARTFFEDGINKVLLGVTTLEELLRVAPIKYDNIRTNGTHNKSTKTKK